MKLAPVVGGGEQCDFCRMAVPRKGPDGDRDYFLMSDKILNGPKWFSIGLA